MIELALNSIQQLDMLSANAPHLPTLTLQEPAFSVPPRGGGGGGRGGQQQQKFTSSMHSGTHFGSETEQASSFGTRS